MFPGIVDDGEGIGVATFEPSPRGGHPHMGGEDPATYAQVRIQDLAHLQLMPDGQAESNHGTRGDWIQIDHADRPNPHEIPWTFTPMHWDEPPVQTSTPYLPGRVPAAVVFADGEGQ